MFWTLAGRMDTEPDLRVRLFVNIHRKQRDDTPDAVLLREFADTFQHGLWPGKRLPETFYDPRSLATEGKTRACLHAKCIVIDDHRALITSANFTEAAHKRNIEAGTVIHGQHPRSGSAGAVRHSRGSCRAKAGAGTPRTKLR